MSTLSSPRKFIVLASLALGGFGIGVTEFVSMGLLPHLAKELLPELWAESTELANAQASWLISAYAFGVVAGAPLITLMTAKWSKRNLILVMLGLLTAMNLLSAALPTFELVMTARFLSGLPHGMFFGVATIIASRVLGPNTLSIAGALILGGLTVANMIGVPIATGLGQEISWRVAYFIVGGIFFTTLVLVYFSAPKDPKDPNASVAQEFRTFKRPIVWLTLAMGAIGSGGFFAVYSYIAPITTDVVKMPESMVPWVLFIIGFGMTVGNLLGGRFGDKSVRWTLVWAFSLSMVIYFFMKVFIVESAVIPFLILMLIFGVTTSAIGPAAQARIMQVSPGSETIAAASHHAGFNIANGLGAYLGGLTVAISLNYTNTFTLAIVLTGVGLVFAIISFWFYQPKTETGQIAAALGK